MRFPRWPIAVGILTLATPAAPAPVPAAGQWKQPQFTTSLPPDHTPLSAEQRAKQAAVTRATTRATVNTAAKPSAHSTIVPAVPGAPAWTPSQPQLLKKAPAAAGSASRSSIRSVSDALGTIPRPSWGTLTAPKPQPVSTIERAPAGAPASAAPTIEPLKGGAHTDAVGKAPEVTTTTPRDPAAPPATDSKSKAREERP